MKINVLPIEIANMIAAGEVVERPASVVKELVENCVDAKASSVTVEIKKGGITYIRVTDNGTGIDKNELITAFKRHATSKIKDASDLNKIYTLGFRGEALASIAAVSRVEVFSKTREEKMGSCAVIEGGEVLENDEAGCSDGTTMIVRNLFYNTPARMKFLKNDATETGYVTDVVNKLILSHPEISVQLINNGRTVISSNGDGKLLSSIYTVFGRDYQKNMKEVSYSDGPLEVTGYIGNSYLARKDRRHQIFFINSRNIISKTMSAAVSEAYKNTVMTGRFPVCILNVKLNAELVDVNVHPTKMEVRFSDEKRIYNLIYWAVKNTLNDKKYVPDIEISKHSSYKPATGGLVMNAPSYDGAKQMEINYLKDAYISSKPEENKKCAGSNNAADEKGVKAEKFASEDYRTSPETTIEPISVKEENSENPCESKPLSEFDRKTNSQTSADEFDGETDFSRFSHMEKIQENAVNARPIRNEEILKSYTESTAGQYSPKPDVDFNVIGQVFGTYIIVQKDEQMLIIDQHAAHERIYFERLLEEFNKKGIQSQMLLLPVTMVINPLELETVEQNIDFFEQLGFGVEIFGQNSIIVRYTPEALEEQDIKDALSDIITLIMNNNSNIRRELSEEALHTVACKRALKGNHTLSEKEIKSLTEQVLALGDGINTCPHGRPIMIKMSRYSLEKQFKRIV